MRGLLQRDLPENFLSHPEVVAGCIVDMHYQFASPCPPRRREEFLNQGDPFPLMNHDALNEALGGALEQHGIPGDSKKWSVSISGLTSSVSTSGVFSSRAVHIRPRTYS
jgi:hypothetical protein